MSLFEKKKKVLVVEDQPDLAESIKIRLSLENWDILIAKDGPEGVKRTRESMPDLILLDVMLPKLDGFEVCRILKTDPNTKNIPIVMLTALQSVGDVDRAFEVGANDYVSKPFTNERLLAKLKKLI